MLTGSAGFIGFHLTKLLLQNDYNIVGVDNLSDYYNPEIKKERLNELERFTNENGLGKNYKFLELDISNRHDTRHLFDKTNFDIVINMAAQPGVRYSLENPDAYIDSNLVGFTNILEGCRHSEIKHLIFASSSSVYGMNIKQPFSTSDNTDYPISLYAATKKSNELLAYSYSHLFNIPTTGLRFFTVYGPYGRPDMAYYLFTEAIEKGEPIDVFNHGEMKRDFTYIDDITQGIIRLLDKSPESKSNHITNAKAPYRIFNIGNNNPVTLKRFIQAIESALGKTAILNNLPMQAGDVPITFADIDDLIAECDFQPSTPIEDGINNFVEWYRKYSKR